MSGLNLSQKVINLFNQSIGDTALRSVVLNRVSECPSSVILCLKLPIKDILCAICRRQSNTINPFRGIEWLLQLKYVGRGMPDLETSNAGFRWVSKSGFGWFWVSDSRFCFKNCETGVSQSLKVSNLPFYTPPFDWQIRSLLIVPKRPLVYLPKVNIHLEIFINFSDSIVSTIDVPQRFDIGKLQNLKAGEVHIMRVPVETE